jgi:hypothetical protein
MKDIIKKTTNSLQKIRLLQQRRNSFGNHSNYSNHNLDLSSAVQMGLTLQNLANNSKKKDTGLIPSKPKAITNLITQKTLLEEEKNVVFLEEVSIKLDLEWENGRENSERLSTYSIGQKVVFNRWIQSGKERDYADLYKQSQSRKTLESSRNSKNPKRRRRL